MNRNTESSLSKNDFITEHGYDTWKSRELKTLTGLLNSLIVQNPDLLKESVGKQKESYDVLVSFNSRALSYDL